MASNKLTAYGKTPQDPYFPQSEPQGPTFLDTEACVCALQDAPGTGGNTASWQCIGNQTNGVYITRAGKWFNGINDVSGVSNLPIYDNSSPPDTDNPLTFNTGNGSLEPANLNQLNVWDKACTGINKTSFSTSFYDAAAQQKRDEVPVAALPVRIP